MVIRRWYPLALIWFFIFNTRALIVSIPPALPALGQEFHLSNTWLGFLGSVPFALFGIAALPGAMLANRLGSRRLITVGGMIVAGGALARLLPPAVPMIFAGTVLIGLGTSIGQPGFNHLIKTWFPRHVALGVNVLGNGMLAGGMLGATLSPIIIAAGGWRLDFLSWGVLAALAAAFWLLTPGGRAGAAAATVGPVLKDRRAWLIASMFAMQQVSYLATYNWVPFLLEGGPPGRLSLVLSLMAGVPLAVSMLLIVIRPRLALSPAAYLVCGLLTVAASLVFVAGWTGAAWLAGTVLAAASTVCFVATLGLPPVVARRPEEIPALTAILMTVGYLASFAGPFIGGVLFDQTRSIGTAFVPSVVASAAIAVIGVPGSLWLRSLLAREAVEHSIALGPAPGS